MTTTAVGALFSVGFNSGRKTMAKFNGTPKSTNTKPKSNSTLLKPMPAGADNLKAGKTRK